MTKSNELPGAYSHDRDLMLSLGLQVDGFAREWTHLGTVTVHPANPDGEYGPKPGTTIEVEVSAFPAHFWRFTITRPRDEAKVVNGKVVGVYTPVERFVMTTGSGGFKDYWNMAMAVAENRVNVERMKR